MNYPQEEIVPYGTGEDKAEQVEQMFDHISGAYDKLNHTLSLGIDRYWRRKAINTLRPFAPQQMLDIATGTGDFAIKACQVLRPRSLMATDISEGMMQVGLQKTREAGLDGIISFAREDCAALSFDADSFDAITVAFGIRNFADLDTCLTEMHRVLKSGGRLVILELSTPQHFPMRQLYKFYSKTVIPLEGRIISRDNSAYTYLPDSIAACPQRQDMQAVIARAGFKDVQYQSLTFGICTLYTATK